MNDAVRNEFLQKDPLPPPTAKFFAFDYLEMTKTVVLSSLPVDLKSTEIR